MREADWTGRDAMGRGRRRGALCWKKRWIDTSIWERLHVKEEMRDLDDVCGRTETDMVSCLFGSTGT